LVSGWWAKGVSDLLIPTHTKADCRSLDGNPEHFNECRADPKHNDEYALAKSCTKEQQEGFWDS
jgi:hypothetical protein